MKAITWIVIIAVTALIWGSLIDWACSGKERSVSTEQCDGELLWVHRGDTVRLDVSRLEGER